MGNLNFNAAEVAPSTGFDQLPAGDFLALVEAANLKPTKKGDGSYIECVFQIVDGQHKGRKIWDRVTYSNPSAKATEIGRARLSALCRALGVMNISDTAELCNRTCVISIGHEKNAQDGKLYARVEKYAPAAGAVAAPISPAAAGAASAPPWKRAV